VSAALTIRVSPGRVTALTVGRRSVPPL